MAHPALIEAVHRQAAETAAAVWAEARAEAARCREEARHAVDRKREALAAELRTVSAETLRMAVADAERRSRAVRAAAKSALGARLLALARAACAGLRGTTDGAGFQALAAELPRRAWTRVIVNPADTAPARALFAGSTIAADAAISGGVIAEDGTLRVTNTLDHRLSALWPDLQPAVLKDVIDHRQRSQPAA